MLGVDSSRIHTIGVSPNLPSHVDGNRFRQKHALGDAPLFVYVGRMMAQKGAAAVVQSACKVWESLPDARFVFIGPAVGTESNIFAGIDPRILYLGRVDAKEKGDALAACDVFIMPSMSEILPTVYLEAWSLSKPVVGGLAPGLRELIEGNGAGKNVSQDPEQIATLLDQLIREKEQCEKMGNAGRELVDRLYTTEAVASQLESLYSRIVEERLN
jgi:glycosyltransferase involved in cell wall biosynthesis